MKNSRLIALVLAGLLGIASCGSTQPNIDGGKGPKPEDKLPPNEGNLALGIKPEDWQKMTPEQRRGALLTIVEGTIRGAVQFLGYQDQALVDAIAAFAVQQEKDLEPVREMHRKVALGLLNNALPEAQITALMNDLRTAETEARKKRGQAIADLDKKIELSKKPRLSAFLALTGLTGEQTGFMGGFLGNVTVSMANLQADTVPPNVPLGPPPGH